MLPDPRVELASRKNLNIDAYAAIGFLLPLIGILLVVAAQPAAPRP